MKGKSIIELRDAHTGEVERHVDHNLVTNGMRVFPGTAIKGTTMFTSDSYFPLWRNWFSGLRLFENKLEEDPDNYIYGYAEPVTGYASNLADTTDPRRGLFNISESGPLEDGSGVRLVWDFAQNQANGQISCVSVVPNIFVTPDNIDNMRYPLVQSTHIFGRLSDGTILGEKGKMIALMMDYNKTTRVATFASNINLAQGKLKKIECVFEPIIYSPLAERTLSIREERDFNIPIPETKDNIQFFLTDSDSYYAITYDGSARIDNVYVGSYNLLSINKQTLDVEETKFNVQKGDGSSTYDYPKTGVGFESNGFLYVACYNGSFKVNVSNPNEIYPLDHFDLPCVLIDNEIIGEDYVVDANGEYQKHSAGVSYATRYPGSYGSAVYNYRVGIIQPIKGLYVSVGGAKYSMDSEMTYGPTISVDTRILYTINNLATPVIKTADKTMKITYILTNE